MLAFATGTTTDCPHDGHLSRFPDCAELTASFFPQSQTNEIRCGRSGRPEFAVMNSPPPLNQTGKSNHQIDRDFLARPRFVRPQSKETAKATTDNGFPG